MAQPKAYQPVKGQKYQLLAWDNYGREYDHLDYAVDKKELDYLMKEYRMSMKGTKLKAILLPQKCWKVS